MSKDVIAIVAIVSIVIWIAVSREAVKPSKEINWRKNDNLTVCRIFIGSSYNHYAFSKPAVLVPLSGALIQQ